MFFVYFPFPLGWAEWNFWGTMLKTTTRGSNSTSKHTERPAGSEQVCTHILRTLILHLLTVLRLIPCFCKRNEPSITPAVVLHSGCHSHYFSCFKLHSCLKCLNVCNLYSAPFISSLFINRSLKWICGLLMQHFFPF